MVDPHLVVDPMFLPSFNLFDLSRSVDTTFSLAASRAASLTIVGSRWAGMSPMAVEEESEVAGRGGLGSTFERVLHNRAPHRCCLGAVGRRRSPAPCRGREGHCIASVLDIQQVRFGLKETSVCELGRCELGALNC